MKRKTEPDDKARPYSIDAAAKILKTDRRTLTAALQRSQEIDFLVPIDMQGTRGSSRFRLLDCCNALELYRIRQAPPDLRRPCPRSEADYERARNMPCPRCGFAHDEIDMIPVLPMHGKRDTPEIEAWYLENGFPYDYPEAGPNFLN